MSTTTLPARIDALEKRMIEISPCLEQVEKFDEWLNGNGKDGAKTELALMKASLRDIKQLLNRLIWATVGLIFSVLGTGVVFFVTQVIPHVAGR